MKLPNAENAVVDRAKLIDDEATLKPGRYKMKRGGFLARHPELKIKRDKESHSR